MSQTKSLPPVNEIINLSDYASKGEVIRDVGPDWKYVGHPNPALGGLKGSPLATPFESKDTGQYRPWLWQQMQQGKAEVLKALRAIGPETVLACWCDPTCYGQVVARAAAWLRTQESALAAAEAPAAYNNK